MTALGRRPPDGANRHVYGTHDRLDGGDFRLFGDALSEGSHSGLPLQFGGFAQIYKFSILIGSISPAGSKPKILE